MNYKLNQHNPIEMLRISEKMSQEQFAEKLGFTNKGQYAHHMRNFTRELINKVNAVYGTDMTMDVINYLKCENRRLDKLCKELSKLSSNEQKNQGQQQVDSDWRA